MPWTCPSCNGETELGYNVCRTCGAERPGASGDVETSQTNLLISTTPSLETHSIDQYCGPVFGETIYGANVLRDFLAGVTDFVGGRSAAYEKLLQRGRQAAMSEMAERAEERGANAVVGMKFDYSTVGNSMLMICCLGTAVKATAKTDHEK